MSLHNIIIIMKFHPQSLKNSDPLTHQHGMQRKRSLYKQPQAQISPQLELPRFYSSDDKIKKKNIIIKTDQHDLASNRVPSKNIITTMKRDSMKYSKTEKNETPTKGEASLNKVRIIQEKLGEAMLKNSSHHRTKPKKAESPQATGQRDQNRVIKEMQENAQTHQNKIRYKINLKKHQGEHVIKKFVDAVETEFVLTRKLQAARNVKEGKAITEEAHKNPLREKSKPVIKIEPMFNDYVTEPNSQQVKKDQKVRTMSTFESVMRPKCKLTHQEKENLKIIQDFLKKTIKNAGNLDYPQGYIVCDKLKYQKKCETIMDPKHHKQYRTNLVLTRLTFYLYAHYILQTLNTKLLLSLFSKLLENHEVIMLLVGITEIKPKVEKYFSLNKYSTKDLLQLNQPFGQIAIENRGNNINRNNEFVKNQLINICSNKNFVHSATFLKILKEEASIDNLDRLAEIDKKLKWQVLKMPTSPFLPAAHIQHKHFLILDLDQTLIHFNTTRETYHVRPFASQFLQNLSKYFELTVFTAATKQYADQIINEIDKNKVISHRLYRNHLTFLMGESLKDLTMLGRDMQTTLIVDNLQSNFRLHPQNGILIKSWYGAQTDNILPKLQNLLIRITLQFPQDLRKGVALYSNYINRQIAERTKPMKLKYDI